MYLLVGNIVACKKILIKRYAIDLEETFPMDFTGAAQSEGEPAIIYISSDEEDRVDCVSSGSISDLASESDEETEEIRVMARCIERQLADFIPIPSARASDTQKRGSTPRPNRPPFHTFSQRDFSLGNENGPLACDGRVRNNHPINVYRNLVPQVDTPLSPPINERGPSFEVIDHGSLHSDETATVDSISSHFRGMAVSEESMLVDYSDCVACSKSVAQIQSEAVTDFLSKTAVPGETLAESEMMKSAFLDGMSAGTFLLMPGGVSQAAACVGYWYSIAYNYYNTIGTIPLD